jgi:hypothetical protein
MKVNRILVIIISTILILLLIIIGVLFAINLYTSHTTEKNAKIQYELMCQNIKENSEYYEDFSKKFISVYEEFGYDRYDTDCGFYEKHLTEERLEYESNKNLIGYESRILYHKGICYIVLHYPDRIKKFNYNSEYYYYDSYAVVYIPDEFMDEVSIETLNIEVYSGTLKNIKDNLFVAWRWTPQG